MKKIFICTMAITFIVILFLFPAICHAQGVTNPGCDPSDPACPIDGGVTALLAIGVGYGIKKIKSFRKKEIVQ